MQLKKILLVLIVCVSIALIALYAAPIVRDFKAEIEINGTSLITYRTLADTSNWNKWYLDNNRPANYTNLHIDRDKEHRKFTYQFASSINAAHEGHIQIIKSNRWNTKINWTEKITLNKGLSEKLRLIFHAAEYRTAFLQNVVQFKNFVEHPDDVYGGITFRTRNIPAIKMVTISDTLPVSQKEGRLPVLYEKITSRFSDNQLIRKGHYFSQYDMINDSLAYVRLGASVTDDIKYVDAPFDLLDTDAHQAIVIQVNNNYDEIKEDLVVMYDWLKKNESRPAAGFWIEHTTDKSIAQVATPSLTLIQEFYSIR